MGDIHSKNEANVPFHISSETPFFGWRLYAAILEYDHSPSQPTVLEFVFLSWKTIAPNSNEDHALWSATSKCFARDVSMRPTSVTYILFFWWFLPTCSRLRESPISVSRLQKHPKCTVRTPGRWAKAGNSLEPFRDCQQLPAWWAWSNTQCRCKNGNHLKCRADHKNKKSEQDQMITSCTSLG